MLALKKKNSSSDIEIKKELFMPIESQEEKDRFTEFLRSMFCVDVMSKRICEFHIWAPKEAVLTSFLWFEMDLFSM